MSRRNLLKLLFYLNLAIVALLIGYKVYLNLFASDFNAIHSKQIDRINKRLEGKKSYSYAVVGHINNSVNIFEKRIIPVLNSADLDFVVSAGDAVSGSGED